MTIRRLSRRTVLRGIGYTAVALPVLEAMGCTRPDGEIVAARSAALEPGGELSPQRFFLMCTGNGGIMDDYFPVRRSDTDFDLGPAMQLEGFALATHTVSQFRDRLLIVDGVDNYSKRDGHEAHAALTTCRGIDANGLGQGRSIDRVIADHIRATDPTAPANLVLNTGSKSANVSASNPSSGQYRFLSYESASTPAANEAGAQSVFDRLFGDIANPEAAAAEAARRQRRASLLDDVLEDYGSLHRRLGAADKRRLDEHMQRIREVEQQLRAPIISCDGAAGPPTYGHNIGDSRYLPQVTDSMFHVIALAFACDLTRVATFMSRSEGETTNHTFPWLSFGVCDNDVSDPNTTDCNDDGDGRVSHHNMSHSHSVYRDNLLEVMQWQVSTLTGFAGRLADVSIGDATLLDSSFCLHVSGNAHTHRAERLPLLGIGSLGGRLQTGRALQRDGASLNDYWLTLLNAFGSPATSFGDEAHATGPIPGMLC
ncbi:MAG: DUF1552 domain-containing protein [Myxococcota bacterium]|nr:DUF1552 domain-containing protein [Myxococcota bacterium]